MAEAPDPRPVDAVGRGISTQPADGGLHVVASSGDVGRGPNASTRSDPVVDGHGDEASAGEIGPDVAEVGVALASPGEAAAVDQDNGGTAEDLVTAGLIEIQLQNLSTVRMSVDGGAVGDVLRDRSRGEHEVPVTSGLSVQLGEKAAGAEDRHEDGAGMHWDVQCRLVEEGVGRILVGGCLRQKK